MPLYCMLMHFLSPLPSSPGFVWAAVSSGNLISVQQQTCCLDDMPVIVDFNYYRSHLLTSIL